MKLLTRLPLMTGGAALFISLLISCHSYTHLGPLSRNLRNCHFDQLPRRIFTMVHQRNPMSLDDDDDVPLSPNSGKIQKGQVSVASENGDESPAPEPMFSLSYDPLEPPSQMTLERDLEDFLMERALRFVDPLAAKNMEKCYLVGLDDKSLGEREDSSRFTMEESLTELSELAGAAGLNVIGSTYQRVQRPNLEYYIGPGKLKDISREMSKHKCTCVVFDVELSPSQQKNLELAFNQENKKDTKRIKVIDRTALILDIFAQHARTKEGQLQVQLALLTYRLPRLTNMWTHLERQSAGARGRSNGGVGLRGPGEKQLESDRRQMKSKIAMLNRAIDSVRRHRSMHRRRRRRLGLPVVALVGYTNAGKSTLLNSFTSAGVFAADMLFATLDPTTRLVRTGGLRNPDILLTDTVGFIQKLPTNLVAAFRATLEEISEADVLLHVTDISNEAWRKQEAAVLRELAEMGLSEKPIVTVWNKIDLAPERKEFLKYEAQKRAQTVAVSATTGEGLSALTSALEGALSSQMESFSYVIPFTKSTLLSSIHNLGILDEVQYLDEGVFVRGKVPMFLLKQIEDLSEEGSFTVDDDDDYDYDGESFPGDEDHQDQDQDQVEKEDNLHFDDDFDWSGLAKGRHAAVRKWEDNFVTSSSSVSVSVSVSVSEKSLASVTGPGAASDTELSISKAPEQNDYQFSAKPRPRRSPRTSSTSSTSSSSSPSVAQRGRKSSTAGNGGKSRSSSSSSSSSKSKSKSKSKSDDEDEDAGDWMAMGLLDFDAGDYYGDGVATNSGTGTSSNTRA